MIKLSRIMSCIVTLLLTSITLFANGGREKTLLNNEWKFKLGNIYEAQKSNYPDDKWETIGLPHSFSIPYFLSQQFYVGYGWYRKTINIDKDQLKKQVSIEFEGVFQVAELFINGKEVGRHEGGYTGFSINISEQLKVGKNTIAIRVNNLWNPQIAPRAGEHVFSGGVYRNVYLVFTNSVHIDWYGTSVTTPTVSNKEASVKVKTDVVNAGKKNKTVQLISEIYSPSNNLVSTTTSSVKIEAGQTVQISQTYPPITSPQLWDIDNPKQYILIQKIVEGNKTIDVFETKFGIRQFEWTADRGFFLNGRHLYLKGANVHQDHAGWGDAVTNSAMFRDLKMLKDAGFNFIRGSHYPHSPAFSKACDDLGLLFWAEGVIWGTGGFAETDGYWNSSAYPIYEKDRKGFHDSAKQQLTELIRIHRNHPSIIAWSMSNEPFFTKTETMNFMKELLTETVELSHQLDATRPAAIGGAQRPIGKDRIDLLGDIAGYNGDGGIIADFQNPGIPNLVSEYGSTTAVRPGGYDPGWGELTKNNTQHGVAWRSGHAIWCAFDHGSIAGSALGKMGIVDYFRLPKRAWYWYRNEYNNIAPPEWPQEGIAAKLSISSDKTRDIKTDGTDDAFLTINVLDKQGKLITNSPDVTLRIISGPGEFPTGSSITFSKNSDITILEGAAAIELRSYYAGETWIEATSYGLERALIKLEFAGGKPWSPSIPRFERPYKRFNNSEEKLKTYSFGKNNPTFTSSAIEGHTGGMATDTQTGTWWEPSQSDKEPTWILDSERNLNITEVKYQFNGEINYKYRIETSEDKENWITAWDFSNNQKTQSTIHLKAINPTQGRFVRFIFSQNNTSIPQLSEVEVIGSVLE